MKITKQQPKKIIKEEMQHLLQERRGLQVAQKIIDTRVVFRISRTTGPAWGRANRLPDDDDL
jgi:hypothetical protein